jgi:hypothetical protein
VFGEHQEASQYYKTFHTETRDRMFAAVAATRWNMDTEGSGDPETATPGEVKNGQDVAVER